MYAPKASRQKKNPGQSVDAPAGTAVWSEDAILRFEKAPPFVREMVMRQIERYAVEKGYNRITGEVIDEAKNSLKPRLFGLNRRLGVR